MKFLIIFFLSILLLRLVAPFLLRWLIKFFIGRQLKKGGLGGFGGFGNFQQQQPPPAPHRYTRPGKLNIDYIPEEKDKKDFRGGDYVEYEEVK